MGPPCRAQRGHFYRVKTGHFYYRSTLEVHHSAFAREPEVHAPLFHRVAFGGLRGPAELLAEAVEVCEGRRVDHVVPQGHQRRPREGLENRCHWGAAIPLGVPRFDLDPMRRDEPAERVLGRGVAEPRLIQVRPDGDLNPLREDPDLREPWRLDDVHVERTGHHAARFLECEGHRYVPRSVHRPQKSTSRQEMDPQKTARRCATCGEAAEGATRTERAEPSHSSLYTDRSRKSVRHHEGGT
jgi:hypothetical protein